jgi:hypothetical protein
VFSTGRRWDWGGVVLGIGLFCGALTVPRAAAQTVLYSDDFDAGTSAGNWVTFDTGDATSDFAYDYSAVGIPSAPNSTGGSTIGLRFSVNNTSGALHAISAYPIGQSFSGNHVLKFDMWLNYNGGPGGGTGSTEFSIAGINHTPTQVHWPNNPATDGFSFAVTGEGGAADDYRAYTGTTLFTVANGVYIAGSQNHTHPYYQALFPSPTYETQGAPGKHWVEVEMRQDEGVITWRLNGTLISIRQDTTYTSGDILLGYMDTYTSIADPAIENFVLYDNVRVETTPPPDCNTNRTADDLDLAGGTSLDCNGTGTPDECETITASDYDADGSVYFDDFTAVTDCLAGPEATPAPSLPACVDACLAAFDSDADHDVDLRDFCEFQRLFWNSPIPPRPNDAMTGSQFMAEVVGLSLTAREQRVLEEITSGNIPDFLRGWVAINVSGFVGGQQRNATYYVLPDYLCIGSDDDFVRMPMTPLIAQPIADAFECILPTRKMVDDIYTHATVKLAPSPISPTTTDIMAASTFYWHHLTIEGQRAGQPLGELIGGIKKDVVITPLLASNPGHVAIYGWHQLNGSPIQPLYLGHIISYVDYSHGIRLVKGTMLVDGVEMSVADVLADPDLAGLLSDEGTIANPSY